jgi:hypothetical protein
MDLDEYRKLAGIGFYEDEALSKSAAKKEEKAVYEEGCCLECAALIHGELCSNCSKAKKDIDGNFLEVQISHPEYFVCDNFIKG